MKLGHPGRCITRVGPEGLVVGTGDGYLVFLTVRFDTSMILKESESELFSPSRIRVKVYDF